MRSTVGVVIAGLVLRGLFAPEVSADSVSAALMDSPRAQHTATLLQNGNVLVWGGRDRSVLHPTGELYDWAADTWRSGPPLLIARQMHTATLLGDGKVLVVGGEDDFLGDVVASAEVYDPVSNRSSGAASIPNARFAHSATLLPNGRVLVVGGGLANGAITADVQLYDPVADSWRNVASLPAPRSQHSATLLANGKVLVTGGVGVPGGSSELYDPALDTWTRIASIARPRQQHAATLLSNGRVLILGGIEFNGNVLLSAELYDPLADAWSEAPAMATARYRATATLLPNGTVLIAGGVIQDGSFVATTELYTPSPPATAIDVIEYFNVALDHYFITWLPSEIAILDSGVTTRGWQRTGYAFKAHTMPQALTSPVCRYYLPPQFGDSHFFGRGITECDATGRNNPTFVLEDATFMRMFLPTVGNCPVGTTAIYRVFSNRPDVNHRYMTTRTLRDEMVARGWLAEGDGADLVVMCAPS